MPHSEILPWNVPPSLPSLEVSINVPPSMEESGLPSVNVAWHSWHWGQWLWLLYFASTYFFFWTWVDFAPKYYVPESSGCKSHWSLVYNAVNTVYDYRHLFPEKLRTPLCSNLLVHPHYFFPPLSFLPLSLHPPFSMPSPTPLYLISLGTREVVPSRRHQERGQDSLQISQG